MNMRTLVGKVAALVVVLLALDAWPSTMQKISGHFALQNGKPLTHGYLRLSMIDDDPLLQHLEIWMTPASSAAPIRNYEEEATKQLHVIIVSSDLSAFMHVHPALGPDGIFRIDQRFPAPGMYYVYADGVPGDVGQQAFRFELAIGNTVKGEPPLVLPTGREAVAGPYTVDLNKVELHLGNEEHVSVNIRKGNKPADDLQPYLGTSAHAVFLNVQDLSYVHVHPMQMASKQVADVNSRSTAPHAQKTSPHIMFHVVMKEPGTYKLWVQFRGGDQLYVVPFVVTVSQ